MLPQGLIPFFLVAVLPVEENVAPKYGLEYIFTVNADITWTREGIDPFGFHVLSRLYCITKKDVRHILTCSLKHVKSVEFGKKEWNDDFVNRRKDVTDESFELIFDAKEGLQKMIVNQKMRTYDLNILRLVVEHLQTGNDFLNAGSNSVFDGVMWSTIGKCSVTFKTTRLQENTANNYRNFKLFVLPKRLSLRNDTVVIVKTINLDNCITYADRYYRKYGETVVCEDQEADLESMTNRMEINSERFVSSTIRKNAISHNSKTYKVLEIMKVELEDVRFAMDEPPAIVNPGKTRIIANYQVESMSTDDDKL